MVDGRSSGIGLARARVEAPAVFRASRLVGDTARSTSRSLELPWS